MELGFSYASLVSPQCQLYLQSLNPTSAIIYFSSSGISQPTVLERSLLIGAQQCHVQTSNALLPKTLPIFGNVVLREGRCIAVASSCALR